MSRLNYHVCMYNMIICLLVLCGMPAIAAPISVDIDKNVNLARGTRNFGPVNVPNDLTVCTLSVDRTNWTQPTSTLSVQLYMSVNNGPFEFWLGMTSAGGSGKGTLTYMTRQLPSGSNRKVQGNYVVSGTSFISTVSVACS